MKPQRAQSQFNCPKQRQCQWFEHSFLLPSSYVNYFFCELIYSAESSSLLQWKHLHESHAEKCPEVWHHLFKPYLQKIEPSVLVIRVDFLLTCSFGLRSLKWKGGKIEPPSRLHVGTEKWSLTGVSSRAESTQALAEAMAQGQCQGRKCPDG